MCITDTHKVVLSAKLRSRTSSAWLEMGAYEALWQKDGATLKTVSEQIAATRSGKAIDLVPRSVAAECRDRVRWQFDKAKLTDVGLRFFGSGDYPEKLNHSRRRIHAFYFRGDWGLISKPSVAVVGTRQLTENGVICVWRIVERLVEDGFTIVAGIASGTDTVAQTTALEMGGKVIALLGTSIAPFYRQEKTAIIDNIAKSAPAISYVRCFIY